MQELMKQYAGQAAPGANEGEESAVGAAVKKAGRRGFAAMFYAQKSGCKCDACRLLRAEIDEMMTGMMETLARDNDSPNS